MRDNSAIECWKKRFLNLDITDYTTRAGLSRLCQALDTLADNLIVPANSDILSGIPRRAQSYGPFT